MRREWEKGGCRLKTLWLSLLFVLLIRTWRHYHAYWSSHHKGLPIVQSVALLWGRKEVLCLPRESLSVRLYLRVLLIVKTNHQKVAVGVVCFFAQDGECRSEGLSHGSTLTHGMIFRRQLSRAVQRIPMCARMRCREVGADLKQSVPFQCDRLMPFDGTSCCCHVRFHQGRPQQQSL